MRSDFTMDSTHTLNSTPLSSNPDMSLKQRLIAGGMMAVALFAFFIGIATIPHIWFRPYIGYVFDVESGHVIAISPDSPAMQAGVRLGDTLTHVDGVPHQAARPLYQDKEIGDVVHYSFLRNNHPLLIEVTLGPQPLPARANYLAHLGLGGVFWLLGVTVFIRRRHDEIAQIFLLMCVCAASVIWLMPLSAWRIDWARRGLYVAILLVGASFLHFHLLFPRVWQGKQQHILRRGTHVIALIGSSFFLGIGPFEIESWTRSFLLPSRLPGDMARSYFVVTVLIGLYFLFSAYGSGSGAVRRRVRLILIGTSLGCLPLVLSISAEVMGYRPMTYNLAITTLVLMPIAYTISLNRSDLMAVDAVLYRVLVFVVVALLLLVGYLALITTFGHINPQAAQTPLTGALASLLVALSLAPVQQTVQASFNRLFYGPGYNYLEVLSDSLRVLSTTLDQETLVEVLTIQVPAAMNVGQAGIWLNDGQNQFRWAGGRLSSKSGDSLLTFPSFLHERLQAGTLVQQVWPQKQQAAYPDMSGPVRWWIPLTLAGELQGVWAIGMRDADESFSPIDQRLLVAAAQQAALVIKVSHLLEQLRRQLQQSEADRQELRQAYAQLLGAREAERKHIARELHDGILQDIFGFDLTLDAVISGGQRSAQLLALQAQIQHLLAEIRRICDGLRPDSVEKFGLDSALCHLADEIAQRFKIEVMVEVNPPNSRLNKETEIALYRIAQEGLNNIVKHADAQRAALYMEVNDSGITLAIEDDGIGFDPSTIEGKRFGLIGIRERVSALKGTLTLKTSPGCGTTLHTHIPCAKE